MTGAVATVCEWCGEPLTSWACGIGHGVARLDAGLAWDGIVPPDQIDSYAKAVLDDER